MYLPKRITVSLKPLEARRLQVLKDERELSTAAIVRQLINYAYVKHIDAPGRQPTEEEETEPNDQFRAHAQNPL